MFGYEICMGLSKVRLSVLRKDATDFFSIALRSKLLVSKHGQGVIRGISDVIDAAIIDQIRHAITDGLTSI